MSKIPPEGNRHQWPDLVAFVAVLATGIMLTVLGHVTGGSLTTACAALVGLYAAWKHLR